MKKRRLIAPTVASILLCALVADSLYFADAPWSVVRFVRKFASGFGAVFAPALDPANYGWLSSVAVPVGVVGAAVIILAVAVLRAKRAMRQATPAPGDALPAPVLPGRIEHQPSAADGRAQSSEEPAKRSYGMVGRLTLCFCAIGLLFAVGAGAIVYAFLARMMDRQIQLRADAVAFGINEVVTRRVRDGAAQELPDAMRKYAAMDGAAFVYVEDREGRIVAHFPQDMPIYLDRDFPRSSEAALRGATIHYRGAAVYEIAKRIDAGGGFVHLGLWRGFVAAEARRAFAPIAALTALALIAAAAAFIAVARAVYRPLADLVRHAEQISKGEFAVPLALQRADEIGEIARSLERLRSSLRAVVSRLDQSDLGRQQSRR